MSTAINGDQIIEKGGQTFIVNIRYTENNTWQGTICWTKTQQTIAFRSALEMIKLMDSALDTFKSVPQEKWSAAD